MDTEIAYLSHDNTIDIQLKASSTATSLGSMTNITATFGRIKVSGSSSASTGAITWAGSGYSTGEVRIAINSYSSASSPLVAGRYTVAVVVYDASHTSGIMWGTFPCRIEESPEGA